MKRIIIILFAFSLYAIDGVDSLNNFSDGTKAKAPQVNYNFNTCTTAVNRLIDSLIKFSRWTDFSDSTIDLVNADSLFATGVKFTRAEIANLTSTITGDSAYFTGLKIDNLNFTGTYTTDTVIADLGTIASLVNSTARCTTLTSDSANISELVVDSATIASLVNSTARCTTLTSDSANISELVGDSATITNITTDTCVVNHSFGVGTNAPFIKAQIEDSSATWATYISNKNVSGYGLLVEAGNTTQKSFSVKNYNSSSDLFMVQGDGKIGVGKTPTKKLDVNGAINVSDTVFTSVLEVNGATNATGQINGSTISMSGVISGDSTHSRVGSHDSLLIGGTGDYLTTYSNGSIACTLTTINSSWSSGTDTVGVMIWEKIGNNVSVTCHGFSVTVTNSGTGGFELLNYPVAIFPDTANDAPFYAPVGMYTTATAPYPWCVSFHSVAANRAVVQAGAGGASIIRSFSFTYKYF